MVLKVYGAIFSTCTQVVVTTLKELKVEYEIVPVSFASGEHKSEAYTSTKQPFGQVPVLVEEDGFQLFESRAIARYAIAKYGPTSGLIPTGDLKELGKFEQAASIEHSNFYPYASGLAAEKVFKPMRGLTGDDARAEENKTTLEAKLKAYDVILGKQKYLAGDSFTLADLLHLAYGTIITEQCGFTLLTSGELPNVTRWWADISGRETWKAVIAERNAAFAAMKK